MRKYELVVILDPELKDGEQEKLTEKIKQFVADAKGEVKSSKDLGKKQLAYPITKKTEGLFWLFVIEAPQENISSVKQKLQSDEKIIRYLLTICHQDR